MLIGRSGSNHCRAKGPGAPRSILWGRYSFPKSSTSVELPPAPPQQQTRKKRLFSSLFVIATTQATSCPLMRQLLTANRNSLSSADTGEVVAGGVGSDVLAPVAPGTVTPPIPRPRSSSTAFVLGIS